jgi:chemotaxis protein CheD
VIRTVLGSCIAVCLYDPVAKIGGMNHYLLPSGSAEDLRYGKAAIPMLIEQCVREGASEERLVAKIFGGAAMQPNAKELSQRVGEANIAFATERLGEHNIPIASHDLGGRYARDIRFDTATGGIKVRRIAVTEILPR